MNFPEVALSIPRHEACPVVLFYAAVCILDYFPNGKMYLKSYTRIISSKFSLHVMARPTRELALLSMASHSSSAGG